MARGVKVMAEFYINPYGGKSGVTIDTEDAYGRVDILNELLEDEIEGRFEEYSVDLVDGDTEEVAMWEAASTAQGPDYFGLALFVEAMDQEDYLRPGIFYALNGYASSDIDEAKDYAEEGGVREGTLKDLAYDFVDEGIIDTENYFDYDAFAHALEVNGELPEEAYDEDTGEQLWDDSEVQDYAEQLVDDIGASEIGADYVDYDKVARDLGFDYDQFTYDGETYTIRTSQ